MVVMAPADENECRQMLYTGFQLDQPSAVRYPRGKGPGVAVLKEMQSLPIGKAQLRRQGKGVALLAFGSMVSVAEAAAESIDATVINMRFVKPLDEEMVLRIAANHDYLLTLEENVIAGGAGSAVTECLAAHGVIIPIRNLGLPDYFVEHGERNKLLSECQLDVSGVLATIQQDLQKTRKMPVLKRLER
jgi:1-deoxy-D-xylulose-5-phosphate synthase